MVPKTCFELNCNDSLCTIRHFAEQNLFQWYMVDYSINPTKVIWQVYLHLQSKLSPHHKKKLHTHCTKKDQLPCNTARCCACHFQIWFYLTMVNIWCGCATLRLNQRIAEGLICRKDFFWAKPWLQWKGSVVSPQLFLLVAYQDLTDFAAKKYTYLGTIVLSQGIWLFSWAHAISVCKGAMTRSRCCISRDVPVPNHQSPNLTETARTLYTSFTFKSMGKQNKASWETSYVHQNNPCTSHEGCCYPDMHINE